MQYKILYLVNILKSPFKEFAWYVKFSHELIHVDFGFSVGIHDYMDIQA